MYYAELAVCRKVKHGKLKHYSETLVWFKHILFQKISMYNIYCHNINTLGYEQKQNAYIVLLLNLVCLIFFL